MKIKEKIITAFFNKSFIEIIENCNKFENVSRNIQYKEGILEILELKKDIDIILIDKKIPGKIKYNELIEKIIEKNSKIKIININKKEELIDFINRDRTSKIILYLGTGGVGKSTVISKIIKNSNEKSLIIDRNYEDNSIFILLNKKRNNENFIKVRENCYFYNKKTNEKDIYKIKNDYEKILIEIHDVEKEYKLLNESNYIYLIVETDLLSIYKTKKIIDKLNKAGIKKEKVKIILNNKKRVKIEKNIINKVFYDYSVITIKEIIKKGEKDGFRNRKYE